MIIETSNLGYNTNLYKVETNARFEQIHYTEYYSSKIRIDRFSSTTIEQLQKALIEQGFTFEYEVLQETGLKVDYTCHYGNY